MALNVTIISTKLIIEENGIQLRFDGRDIIRAIPSPINGSAVIANAKRSLFPQSQVFVVTLTLTGDARTVLGDTYVLSMLDVSNQATWTNDQAGADIAAAAIAVMIRSASGGAGGGQVDTIVPGDAIDVDSTDPANPIVNVKVDGITIGFNGSNELEVPAGGGGYVPTTRSINTTSPLAGGGTLAANLTLTHQNSGVAAGSYTNASVTVNATGHVTSASSGAAPVTSVGATYPIQSSGGATPTISADASTGGNGAADAGKLLAFGAKGEIKASSANGINAVEAFTLDNGVAVYGENNGTGNAIVGTALGGGIAGTFTATGNTGVLGQSDTQPGVEALTDNTTEPALHVQNNDATNTGPIAHFHNLASQGLELKNDGGLTWSSATGAQTTANGLPVFSATLKGVVPAAGAVPSATKFLDETGAWAVPPGTGVTAVSVATANGLAGSSSGGATPALTLSTTVTGILSGNGTAISAAATTGSGSVVLATSPTLVTPALGTPTALTLTNATGLPAATGLTGQVAIANGGTGQSTQTAAFNALSPTTTKGDIIVDDGTDAVRLAVGANGTVLMANSAATNGIAWVTRPVSFPVIFGLNGVTIAVTTTETVYNSTTVHQIQRDLTNYSQVRLVVNRQGTAGPTGAKAILKYRVGGQSTTVANFSDIGTSEVSCDIVTANTQAVSSWIDLAAGAKADVMITVTLVCSSGTASPILGSIEMQCR